MKSIVLHKFGHPAEFTLDEVAMPSAGPGEVLVKMSCAPVNPADVFSLMGVYGGFTASLPGVPGLDGMGVVSAVGEGVTSVKVGQRVTPLFIFGDKYLKAGKGSWTEYAVFAAEDVVPVPDGVSDAAASQLVVNPFTVVAMLRELDAPAGEWVIQSGAGSVLGRMFIQIAKARGLKTISVVRRAELVDELTSLGGDAVFVSGVHDIPAEVKALTGGRGCWGGIDSVGADVTPVLTACIRNGGTLLIYGAMGGLTFQGSIVDCLFRDVHIRGFWISPFISAKGVGYCHELAAEVWALFLSGVVTPYSGKTFPLAHAAEAVAESVKAARGGKVLLTM